LDEALSGGTARRFVDPDAARATLRAIESGAPGSHVEFLLRLVNLGLLEQLVADPPAPPAAWRVGPAPQELVVGDWDAERPAIESAVRERPPLDPAAAPVFADGVMLVRA